MKRSKMGDFCVSNYGGGLATSLVSVQIGNIFMHVMDKPFYGTYCAQTESMPKGEYRMGSNDGMGYRLKKGNKDDIYVTREADDSNAALALAKELARLQKETESLIRKNQELEADNLLYKSFHDHVNAYSEVDLMEESEYQKLLTKIQQTPVDPEFLAFSNSLNKG